MGEKCAKCDLDFSIAKECIKCTDCRSLFHPGCTKIGSDEKFKKMTAKVKNVWKCESCKSETSSSSSRQPDSEREPHAMVLEAITAFREDTNKKWEKSFERFDKLESEFSEIKTQFSDLKQQFGEVVAKSDAIGVDVKSMKAENAQLKEEVRILKESMLDVQQYSRINNLIINGIPMKRGEDLMSLLGNIAHLLRIQFYQSDIDVAHRLAARQGSANPPAVIVRFVSRAVKWNWLTAMKAKKTLSTQELQGDYPDQQIYLNEHMTPETRDLFNRGRDMVKRKQLVAAWVRDGRVMVRKTTGGRSTRVRHSADLARLLQAEDTPAPATPPQEHQST